MSKNPLQENKMGVMPIGRLLINMATPMIISMLIQAMYNIVDSIYVSQISESAVTALSLAFPVQNMQIGFSVGIGVGVNSLLSKSLGEKNQEAVNLAAGNGMLLVLVTTVVFMIFGMVGTRPFFEMQSEVAETVEAGVAYTRICCVFTLGIFVQMLMERLLQATGRTMLTMVTQVAGAVINIILDPILIHGWFGLPAMGVAGAAVATVIGQWAGAVLGLYLNLKHNPEIRFGKAYLRPNKKAIGNILSVGIPSVIMNSIGSVTNFSMNQILLGFRGVGETAAGVFGIYFKVQSLFIMPLIGINNASISVIAYNYGARLPERIMKAVKIGLVMAFTVMLVGFGVFQVIPDKVMGIFASTGTEDAQNMIAMGANAMRVVSIHFLLAAIGIPLSSSFQALGNGIYSTIVSLCRQLVVLLPAAYLLAMTGNVDAVWWSFPIAEVLSSTMCILLFLRIYQQKIKPLYEK